MKQQAHSLRITTAEYSPDGSSIATGAEDGKVKIWNCRSSFCTVTFDEHTSGVTAVKWTQNGRAILSASLDGTVRAHDLKRYSLIVAGGDDRVIRVVGVRDFKNLFIHPLSSHKGTIVSVQFMKNSYDMITVCKRGLSNVWTCNLRPGELKEGVWKKDEEENGDQEMDQEVEEEKVEKIFFEKTKKYWLSESSGSGKSVDVTAAQYHAETKVLVTAFNNGAVVLHEIPTFALIHNLRVSEMRVQTVAWNLTGGDVHYINLITETNVYTFRAARKIKALKFSPDGKKLAIGRENDLQIHEIGRMDRQAFHPFCLMRTYKLSGEQINSIDWSDDSKWVFFWEFGQLKERSG
uniref:WD_REPEATS_REGION domain-containing protein n=1 Tax=Caenorhabditis japonica TaxID=281687 RepID=A0A8R1HXW2_CAEJA